MNIKEEAELMVPLVERLLRECAHTELDLATRLNCGVTLVFRAVGLLRERGLLTSVPRPLLPPLVWIQGKSEETPQ